MFLIGKSEVEKMSNDLKVRYSLLESASAMVFRVPYLSLLLFFTFELPC